MPLIEALTFVVVGAASIALTAMIMIVVCGIKREERRLTLLRRLAPGLAAWMTRRIIGVYVRKQEAEPVPADDRIGPTCARRR